MIGNPVRQAEDGWFLRRRDDLSIAAGVCMRVSERDSRASRSLVVWTQQLCPIGCYIVFTAVVTSIILRRDLVVLLGFR
jgi:hypothetical protein